MAAEKDYSMDDKTAASKVHRMVAILVPMMLVPEVETSVAMMDDWTADR